MVYKLGIKGFKVLELNFGFRVLDLGLGSKV